MGVEGKGGEREGGRERERERESEKEGRNFNYCTYMFTSLTSYKTLHAHATHTLHAQNVYSNG